MLPPNVSSNLSRVESSIALMESAIPGSDIRVQGVFSSHLVILASGHVEISVREIIGSYVKARSNPLISNFSIKTLERENSLNSDKICTILDKFNKDWKTRLFDKLANSEKEAVDSLKTLRDQIAHGKPNGTGYLVVKQYFKESCKYIGKLNDVVFGA
jgi:hypothetical protein